MALTGSETQTQGYVTDLDGRLVISNVVINADTIADGADVTEGAVADAVVAAGATGTISAKLRRISQDIGDLKAAIKSATATTSLVPDNAASVTLLASNSARNGATIQNDSTVDLYAKCGATATTTDYTVKIPANAGYWEVPFGYTGRIDGIWASDPNAGAARVTEFTA